MSVPRDPRSVEPKTIENILLHLGLDATTVGVAQLGSIKSDVISGLRAGVVTRSGAGGLSAEDEVTRSVLSTQSLTGATSLDSTLVCSRCKNSEPEQFEWNADNGDVVCRKCGTVAMDHALFEGEAHRNFDDDEEDKSHAGRNVSEHYSDSYNLATVVMPTDGSEDKVKELKRTLREIETIEHLQGEAAGGVRFTRLWYKDNMKRKAFQLIREVCADLFLGEYAQEAACAKFAKYRDAKDKVRSFKLVVAACIVLAVEEEVRKRPPPPEPKLKCDRCPEAFHTPRQLKDHYYSCPGVPPAEIAAMRVKLQKEELVKKRKLRASEPDFLELGDDDKTGPKRPYSDDKYVLDPPGSLFKAHATVENSIEDAAIVPPVLPSPDELLES